MIKLLSIIFVFFIFGCSMQYHEKAFYKKGGVFNCQVDTIRISDTIIDQNGNTRIVYRDSIVGRPVIEYIPKYVYRYKYKTAKAEIRYKTKYIKEKGKTERVFIKQKEKTARGGFWKWAFVFVCGMITMVLLRLIYKKWFHEKLF